jgi:hypothetical protein
MMEPEESAEQHRNRVVVGIDNTLYASVRDAYDGRYRWISLSYN